MLRRKVPLVIFLLLAALAPIAASAQQPADANPFVAASNWTVAVMTGEIGSTALRMADDMATVLNDGPNLRIVPMVGESSIRNVNDLFYLKGVDMAVVQSDVLAHLRRTRRMPEAEEQLQYVAKLHSAEFHILSRMKYMCLADLAGRKVNFGPAGSGSALTAQTVFEASKVQVDPQYLDHGTAAEKLRRGEIDATVFVSGKPTAAFQNLRHTDGVHFLDVSFAEGLQRDYLPAIMTHDDYPDLIAPAETVSTIAVSTVIAVSRSPERSDRYRKLERFVESFFNNYERFLTRPYHEKWQEVTLSAPIAGWTRFPAAQDWLKENPDSAAARSGTGGAFGFQPAAREAPADLVTGSTGELSVLYEQFRRANPALAEQDREKLFKDFVRWYQQGKLN